MNAPSSALEIRSGQQFWDDFQNATLNHMGLANANNADRAVFLHVCQRTGLDPFAKQIYMIERKSKNSFGQWESKWTIQTAIDGFRLIARRAVDKTEETLGYQDTLWCGKDGVWHDVWLEDGPPAAVKVTVLRGGQPYSAVALYSEYVQTYKDKAGKEHPTSMWVRMPANQLAKVGEALALRKACPQDLSGIYTDDEMAQAGDGVEHQVTQTPAPDVVRGGQAALEYAATHGVVPPTVVYGEQRAPEQRIDERTGKLTEVIDTVTGEVYEPVDTHHEFNPTEPAMTAAKSDPDPSAGHAASPAEVPPISPPMIRNIFRLLTKLGIDTSEEHRDERLALVSGWVGEPVESLNDLNLPQGHIVIDRLNNMVDEAEKLERESA